MTARIALEIGGAFLVLFGLREVFRDIFHPTRSGTLSDFVGRFASLLMRRTRLRAAVGPVSLVSVILCWVIFLATGFALIYCGLLPQEVSGPPGATSGTFAQHFLKSLYFSLGAFDTFQTFDLSPQTNWLRFVISIEGLIGISMITASVSWLVLLYPALARCRRFAKYVSLLVETEKRAGVTLVRHLGTTLPTELARGVLQFRLDIVLFPILVNFYAEEESAMIANVLPQVCKFAADAIAVDAPESTHLAGIQLQVTLEDLARVLAERVVQTESTDPRHVFLAFQRKEQ
jgi:hypothetical protein